MRRMRIILTLALALLLPVLSPAVERGTPAATVRKAMAPLDFTESGKPFFDDRTRGWHFYESPIEEMEPEEDEPVAPPKPEAKAEPAKPQTPAGPPAMSADWLKANLPKYLTKAIDNPTDENVRAYLYLQRYGMDKAQQYATASQRVTLNDPYLDFNARKPLSAVGSQVSDQIGLEERMALLKDLSKDAGLLFYFTGTCEHCKRQWPLVKAFSDKYKFSVMPVSMDGMILDGMNPKNVVMDAGQAQMMGVTVYPSIYLFKPPSTFSVVSHGVAAVEAFPELIASASMAAGMINEKQYMRMNGTNDMSVKTQLIGPDAEAAVQDPKSLVEYMKAKMKARK